MQARPNFFRSLLAVAALVLALPLFAQQKGEYALIQPAQPTDNPGKIEVVEFFSYGCPHCAQFHEPLSAWSAKLPKDVVFKRVPVSFGRPAWANIAKMFYALEATGDLPKLDAEIFKAINEQRVMLFDEKTMMEWLAKKGINTKTFADAFNSFGVQSKLSRGDQLVKAVGSSIPKDVAEQFGVPALVVDGKYLVPAREYNEMLAVTDKLIAKVRTDRAKK